MTILLWVLSLLTYFGFLWYTTSRPSDINLIAGIAAVLVGLVGLVLDKKMVLLFSYGIMLVGELLLYNFMMRTGIIYVWVIAMAVTLFFGVLSLRQE